ncbi:TonB-dependent receptor [Pelagicoccus sp. SDUM812005]|uniref:TonB-dependent receptor plug domain-containing protein n=1 Tax=Pelagicoccus sp. SDUM812005 TaxID=3041257 RepID=UPI00280EC8EB|nr:TonB-dependent receptor [Pelagicoccus sp. SDUM812005]MDQ8179376.1 TonB-dependent receptor [Pelagicoccus sp. SDUM812005]
MGIHPPTSNTRVSPTRRLGLAALALSSIASVSLTANDFSGLSLEELASMPVIESSKSGFQLFDAPNGAFVFDEEAIQNLPVDSIPEMLRYAPGVHIMRSSNGAWGLGVRGMNSRFFSRALFTVDEQSQNSTLFNGLFGSDHDLLLDDVASVEVVYGPGGSLWGTNAANGRVNVILKSVFETEGTVLKTRVGNLNRSTEGRHGWLIDQNSGIRVWAKHSERQSAADLLSDAWTTSRAGIRYEKRPNSGNLISLSAEYFDSELGFSRSVLDPETGYPETLVAPETQSGFNTQLKWTHHEDRDNGFSLRGWVGSTDFRSLYANYDFSLGGLEFRSLISPSERHKFVLSAGVVLDDETLFDSEETSFLDDYTPRKTTAHLGGEYTLTLSPQKLELTAGLSASYDSYTDHVEPLPSARLLYRLNDASRIWLAYSSSSRAVPSGITSIESMKNGYLGLEPFVIPTPYGDFTIDTQLLNLTNQGIELKSERLDAIEIGYRSQYQAGGSLVVTAFLNEYADIIGFRDFNMIPVLAVADPYLLNQMVIDNLATGRSYGLEFSRDLVLGERSKLLLNYSYIGDRFEPAERFAANIQNLPTLQAELETLSNNVPTHQASLWYSQSFTAEWQADLGLRYKSGYASPRSNQEQSMQGDLRLTWQPNEQFRLSLVGRNLLDPQVDETYLKDYIGIGSEIKREAYLEMNLEF